MCYSSLHKTLAKRMIAEVEAAGYFVNEEVRCKSVKWNRSDARRCDRGVRL